MKLAFITQDFPPDIGGIQTYSFEIASRIHDKFDDFILIAPDKNNAPRIDARLPFEIHRVPTRNSLLGLRGIPSVLPLLKKREIDHCFHAQWQTLGIAYAAKKAGIVRWSGVAAHAREFFFNPFEGMGPAEKLYEQYKRKMLRQADFFFPVSSYTSEILTDYGVPIDSIEVVINGTNPDLFYPISANSIRQKYGFGKQRKILATITRLIERKAVDTVLRAVALLKDEMPDLHYIIVGEGPYGARLKKLAAELEVKQRVTFTGRVPYDKVNEYYNLCDLYVMPSKKMLPEIEAFGIAYLEANACQKPVIGSRTGGVSDAVIDGETGLLVEERNPEELATAIKRILTDEELRKRLGEQGRKRVENEANWQAVSDKLFSLIQTHGRSFRSNNY
jgi:phosphatidylinositol alpha-1,6-mannosyltransferase